MEHKRVSDMPSDMDVDIQDNQGLINKLVLAVRSADLPTLHLLAHETLELDRLPSLDLSVLSDSQQADVLRGSLLVYILSLGNKVPCGFQLEAVLGSLGGHDGIVSSATGSGKTMIMILLLLLRLEDLSILIVPLKRLQQSQASTIT
jgi:ATP-dependent helicase YprA (DUF1998 family)